MLLFDQFKGLLSDREVSLISNVRKAVKEWFLLLADIEESTDAAIDVLNDLINYDKICASRFTFIELRSRRRLLG
jgi:hypothetical protein